MSTPAPRSTIVGVVLATTASRDRKNPRRLMVVRTDDGRELTGSIPALLRQAATTLAGRRVQFSAVINDATNRFSYPTDATIVAPVDMARDGSRFRRADR